MGSCQHSLCCPSHKSCNDYQIFPFHSRFSSEHCHCNTKLFTHPNKLQHPSFHGPLGFLGTEEMNSGRQCAKRELKRSWCLCANSTALRVYVFETTWTRRQKWSSFQKTASGVSAIPIFLQLLPRERGNRDLNHSCWRYLTLVTCLKPLGYFKMSRCSESQHWSCVIFSKMRINHNSTIWHSTSGNTVLIDSPLQTLWWRSSPHEGLKPPAQVPIVLCMYTRVSSSSGQPAWVSPPSTLFHGNYSLKLNFTDVFSATQAKLLVQVYLILC